jgi:hypothetical protein
MGESTEGGTNRGIGAYRRLCVHEFLLDVPRDGSAVQADKASIEKLRSDLGRSRHGAAHGGELAEPRRAQLADPAQI